MCQQTSVPMSSSSLANTNDSNNVTLTKPKQPLSAYNLYFQLERKRIIAGTDHLPLDITPEEVRSVSRDHASVKPKRQHRKSHGKIGFRDLARLIAQRWKKIDAVNLRILEEQAQVEKQKYTTALRLWKEQQKQQQQLAATSIMASQGPSEQRLVLQQEEQVPLAMPLSTVPYSHDLMMAARHRMEHLQALRAQIESEIAKHLVHQNQEDQQARAPLHATATTPFMTTSCLNDELADDDDLLQLEPLQVESTSPMCVPSFPRTMSVQNILFSLAHMGDNEDEAEQTTIAPPSQQDEFPMDSFLFNF